MPKYSVLEGNFPRFDGRVGVLLDATGARIEYPIACDTETGEVERYARTGGQFRVDPETHRVAVINEVRPAPLTYVRDERADAILGAQIYRAIWNQKIRLLAGEPTEPAPGTDDDPQPFIVGG